jgi:hypothetical protein
MSYYLPKWPQMYTTGASVTKEQAKEIIQVDKGEGGYVSILTGQYHDMLWEEHNAIR